MSDREHNESPQSTEEKESIAMKSIAEKMNLSEPKVSRLHTNIFLLTGSDQDGKLLRYICKKPRNPSPLLENSQDRESLFYHHLASNLPDNTPRLVGEAEGFEVFQYLESSGDVDPDGMRNILPAIQKIEIPDVCKQDLTGEYTDKARFLTYLDQICFALEKNPTYQEMALFLRRKYEAFSTALEYLNSLPQVLTHGDFWRGNAIRANEKLYILDWENCQINNNFYDLSTLYHTEKLMIGNEELKLQSADETALEYNFILQTVSQIIPELVTNNLKDPWVKTWLREFLLIVDKCGANR